ncbi:hypothetical protein [Lactiplantibacillus fabifermentans]|uniref:Uncharacterized protein n=1 Tax=Lactiplantibacillus fabifermentans DSM 21115 TaxID=1413187 RepID=A0A0R2NS86_9LACO|nr:hypothetical protein [Lactiplantibacillus fabifermentans]KRO28535.1 hypothetical protein DY78_GL002312 [Lactiplantibacillus fabifermentans DSM 21115]
MLPDWLLNWSRECLIFITILTLVSVILLQVPLRETLIVDFVYMVVAFPFAWRRGHPKDN